MTNDELASNQLFQLGHFFQNGVYDVAADFSLNELDHHFDQGPCLVQVQSGCFENIVGNNCGEASGRLHRRVANLWPMNDT